MWKSFACLMVRVSCASILLALASCGGDDDSVKPIDESDLTVMLEPLLDAEITGAARNLQLPSGPAGCLAITPTPWNDADGDGVPDDATFTFDEEGCAFSFPGGGGTTGGAVRVTDPGEAFGYQAELIGYSTRFTSGDPPTTTIRRVNGVETVAGSPTGATLVREVTMTTEMTGVSTSTAIESLTVVYTPDPGSTLVLGVGAALPPGTMTMSGTISWSLPERTIEMAISTVTPLIRSGGCDFSGPDSGVIQVTVVSGADPGHLNMEFADCEPSVEWYPER